MVFGMMLAPSCQFALASSHLVPPTALERSGTGRLVRALRSAREHRSVEAEAELMASATTFACEFRQREEMPERCVIALKAVFAGLDGRAPSLAEAVSAEAAAETPPLCAAWYPLVFMRCVEAYFACTGGPC